MSDMETAFDETVLHKRLSTLVFWKQLAFLLSICERLLPSFVVFANETGHHGTAILRACIRKAWDCLLAGESSVDLSSEAARCESVAPDTEDYQSNYVSSALDAALAVSALMKAFSQNDTVLIVEGATMIRDSVDMYVQELEGMDPRDPNLEANIIAHELMQKELKRQREDIEYLENIDNEPIKSMQDLKNKWFGKHESCLGLGI